MIHEDLENKIRDVTKMSDAELAAYRSSLRENVSFSPQEIDLQEYKRSQRKQLQEEESLSVRVRSSLKKLFSPSPERVFTNQLTRLKRSFTVYEKRVRQLDSLRSDRLQEQRSASRELHASELYFKSCIESYQRLVQQVDMVEAEVELLSESTDSVHPDVYAKKEQLLELKDSLISLRQETDQSMVAYTSVRNREYALRLQSEELEGVLTELETQKNTVAIHIHNFEMKKRLHYGAKQQNVQELYENIGILTQKVNNTLKEHQITDSRAVFDGAYRANIPSLTKDSTVDLWQKIKSV